MTSEELRQDKRFQLLLVLEYDALLPFLHEQLREGTIIMKTYVGFLLFFVSMYCWEAMGDVQAGLISLGHLAKATGLGMLLAVTVLIVVHESIHGVAYKLMGAKKVSFGANWQKFYFYAIADKFVVGRKAFVFIALAPFLVVLGLSACSMLILPGHYKWMVLGAVFVHSLACVGDFAMLGFYEKHRHFAEMLTFDEESEGRSYVYVREH